MKKWIIRLIVLILAITLTGCQDQQLAGTPFDLIGLNLLNDTAAEDYADEAAFVTAITDGAAGDYANRVTTDMQAIPTGTTVVSIYVCGGATDGDTAGVIIVGYGDVNGPIEVVCTANGIVGTQDVVLYPHDASAATNRFWVDTWTIVEDNWKTSTGVTKQSDGSNYINTLSFDPLHLKYIKCFTYGVNGGVTAGEADDVTIYAQFLREGDQ